MRRPAVALTATALTTVGLWAISDKGVQDLPLGIGLDGAETVTLELPTAEGIAIGADVRTGQRVVGQVSSMSLSPTGASVQLRLQDGAGLPADSTASVELPSALGNPFVRLSAPASATARALRDGDVIPPSRTQLGPQIESALATFGALMSRSGVDQLAGIVTEAAHRRVPSSANATAVRAALGADSGAPEADIDNDRIVDSVDADQTIDSVEGNQLGSSAPADQG